jgi:hypothetical protein
MKIKTLRDQIKNSLKPYRASIHFKKNNDFYDCFCVSGEYDSILDESGNTSIFLTVHYNFLSKDLSDDLVSLIRLYVSITLEHELIHRQQYSRRFFEEQRIYESGERKKLYLGSPDEIHAFANTIALRTLVDMDRETAINYLKTGMLVHENHDYADYKNSFVDDPNVIKKLQKYIYKNLLTVDLDKLPVV